MAVHPETHSPLPDPLPAPAESFRRRVEADYDRFRDALPEDLTTYVADRYGIDLRGEYAGRTIRNPFGKASGQLSLNARQVRRDAEGGLGFVVLKTVIARDETGAQRMAGWAIPETRMRVERVAGPAGEGWTVTWKGRGWSESFAAYCDLFREAISVGRERGMAVAPSVKYHLPAGEEPYHAAEYRYTTRALQAVWLGTESGPMPLEKDFSPTLAGDERSREKERILGWLRRVPDLIRSSADRPGLSLGIKLMNARFEAEFQVEMLRAAVDGPEQPPDFLVYANRLFDPEREFEGVRGAAYGGPELSARNLRSLGLAQVAAQAGAFRRPLPPISATGDILTGRRAAEYGLLGAMSCQLHTAFQLPDTEFAARTRNKSAAVLHHLLFHPEHGLLVTLDGLRLHAGVERLSWLDLARSVGKRQASGAAARPNAGRRKRPGSE
jgi:hypothetical protein